MPDTCRAKLIMATIEMGALRKIVWKKVLPYQKPR
jgi:hypothetical protein